MQQVECAAASVARVTRHHPSLHMILFLTWIVLVANAIRRIIAVMPKLSTHFRRGLSDLPFVLVLLGVLGGAIAFGLIGIFLGPTLLAVGYNLFREWTMSGAAGPASRPDASPSR